MCSVYVAQYYVQCDIVHVSQEPPESLSFLSMGALHGVVNSTLTHILAQTQVTAWALSSSKDVQL